MYLDGFVEVAYLREHFQTLALIMAMSVLLPQLLIWLFLRMHQMASWWVLGRILLCPSISAALLLGFWYWSYDEWSWLKGFSVFLVVVSPEPWFLLMKAWSDGRQSTEAIWTAMAEGLLEAPSSCAMSLYVAMLLSAVTSRGQSKLFLFSSISSIFSITLASTKLHFYGQNHSWAQFAKHFAVVKCPQTASQVLGYAFFAFATRPLPKSMDDLQQHNAAFLIWSFLALEVALNWCLLKTLGPNMGMSKAMLLACSMVVGGPPGFLASLDAARPAHAIQHVSVLLIMLAVAWRVSSPAHFSVVWHHYPIYFGVFVLTAIWAPVAATLTSDSLPHSDRKERSADRLAVALVEDDPITAALLIEVDGAVPIPDSVHIVGSSTAVPQEFFIDTGTGLGFGQKWLGIAQCNRKLYCCPLDAAGVLVTDPDTGSVNLINSGKGQGGWKWAGIAQCRGKLYCCPYNAAEVLVVDPDTDSVSFIDTGQGLGGEKWYGIAQCNGKLYCCPQNAAEVLVIDPDNATVSFIETGKGRGGVKWASIAQCNGKLYCCPYSAAEVLVIDPDSASVSFIDAGKGQVVAKWEGVAQCAGKLYCCPCNAAEVLVIDPNTASVSFIGTGKGQPGMAWRGIAHDKGKLYCAPANAREVLVIDSDTDSVSFIDTGKGQGGDKWRGIAQCNGKLYCCPTNAEEVLVIDPSIVQSTRAELFMRLLLRAPHLKCHPVLSACTH
eukprot:TRINITY_DN4652_c0_g1_i1.p1 TRINITY_DN4652_c0_g1~~TRINITY_DN4652_c0_g1_i1.p1  ORF type:complete len:844 (-),score=144.71 TRINITY_DN4652_c0_g1_i1:459-2618(-)